MRRAVTILAIIASLALTGSFAFYSFSLGSNIKPLSTSPCPSGPSALNNGPASGWEYFLAYNTTDGRLISLVTAPSCQFASGEAFHSMFSGADTNAINATSSAYLHDLIVNGYLNTFYVRLDNEQLTMIPGVTFGIGSHQAYFYGQPITNGTRIALPAQSR